MSLYQINGRSKASGSITVYLSLILLLILSLLLTIIEGARVCTAQVYAGRSLSTSMDSVLAEYYGPLWEEYHIFGYYSGAESISEQRSQIAEKMSDLMSYTFEPDKELDFIGDRNIELHDITTDSVAVENETYLFDYQGKLLINEAVEYMKYREAGNGIEKLLNKLSLFETPEKVSYVYEKKQKVENELVEIDKGILELMELLDGLCTGKKGIEVSKAGNLKTSDYFVKKICIGEVTEASVGINHDKVFLALKNSYVNPLTDFETIEADFTQMSQTQEQINAINTQTAISEVHISSMQAELSELNATAKKTSEEKQQIKALNKEIKSLKEEIRTGEATVAEQTQVITQEVSNINSSKKRLSELITGIEPTIIKAMKELDQIIFKTETAAPIIEEYETYLNGYRDQIDEKTFSGLEESLIEMKKYVTVKGNGYDFQGMKAILEQNLDTLTKVSRDINEGYNTLATQQYEEAHKLFLKAAGEIKNYQIKGLTLDYSTLVLDNSVQESSLNAVNNLMQAGITSLVIDSNMVSDKELSKNTRPSEIAALSTENIDYLSQLKEFFEAFVIGSDNAGMSSIFNSFGNGTKITDMAAGGINALAEQLLYQEYLKEHFGMYQPEKNSSSEKPSALSYEQEYLLAGKLNDQENLASVISRIVFLRTILDFVSVIGDSAKRNEARAAASALVGFTGLPILVGITQVLILIAWAFAEALLDTSVLMFGKDVPVLKKSVTLQLPELFLINRGFLREKALSVKASKEISMSYEDYLRMFLVLKSKTKLAYHSLDLMQENIKLRYTLDSFDITRCLYGYEADMEYNVPAKFIGISFVQKFLRSGKDGFHFKENAAYSY